MSEPLPISAFTPATGAPIADDAPLNCMVGDTKTINDAIRRAAISARGKDFLLLVMAETFGNAGWHRRRGQDEHVCAFDLAVWARRLEWHKPNVLRIREQLVALGVLTWEPNGQMPGQGRLAWNMALDAWLPLRDDYRRARYARRGDIRAAVVGDVRVDVQQAGVSSLNTSVSSLKHSGQAGVSSLNTNAPSKDIKLITATGDEPATNAAPMPAVRKEGEQKRGEKKARIARERAGATPSTTSLTGTAPEPPTVGDVDLDAALAALYAVPGWRPDARAERAMVEELCAEGVGQAPAFAPALLAYAAREAFPVWLARKADAEATSGASHRRTRPDSVMFKRFLLTAQADVRQAYTRERAAAAMARQAEATARATRERTAAARMTPTAAVVERVRATEEREREVWERTNPAAMAARAARPETTRDAQAIIAAARERAEQRRTARGNDPRRTSHEYHERHEQGAY